MFYTISCTASHLDILAENSARQARTKTSGCINALSGWQRAQLVPSIDIELVLVAVQLSIMVPALEGVVDRALWRKVFGQGAPLAAGAEEIHLSVNHLPDGHGALVAAALGRPDQRPDQSSFLIRQISGVAQSAPVITPFDSLSSTLANPRESTNASMESHGIQVIQGVSGQLYKQNPATLTKPCI